jgi:metallo-beta-lactamase family protein
MRLKLRFLGANKSVTGSRFLLEAGGKNLLIDCGLHQERELKERDWGSFPVNPNTIDAVLLTHAHLDHSGYLPKLVRQGFRRPVYCTAATVDITKLMLMDAAKIQMIDA